MALIGEKIIEISERELLQMKHEIETLRARVATHPPLRFIHGPHYHSFHARQMEVEAKREITLQYFDGVQWRDVPTVIGEHRHE